MNITEQHQNPNNTYQNTNSKISYTKTLEVMPSYSELLTPTQHVASKVISQSHPISLPNGGENGAVCEAFPSHSQQSIPNSELNNTYKTDQINSSLEEDNQIKKAFGSEDATDTPDANLNADFLG